MLTKALQSGSGPVGPTFVSYQVQSRLVELAGWCKHFSFSEPLKTGYVLLKSVKFPVLGGTT